MFCELRYCKRFMYELIKVNRIRATATIYDSIYFIIEKDAEVAKWLSDTIIPIMTADFLVDQVVGNDADLCIGTRWSNVEDIELKHNSSEEEIDKILKEL